MTLIPTPAPKPAWGGVIVLSKTLSRILGTPKPARRQFQNMMAGGGEGFPPDLNINQLNVNVINKINKLI
jgi:hypothetical protein